MIMQHFVDTEINVSQWRPAMPSPLCDNKDVPPMSTYSEVTCSISPDRLEIQTIHWARGLSRKHICTFMSKQSTEGPHNSSNSAVIAKLLNVSLNRQRGTFSSFPQFVSKRISVPSNQMSSSVQRLHHSYHRPHSRLLWRASIFFRLTEWSRQNIKHTLQ